jgi:ankyrin repeat protein
LLDAEPDLVAAVSDDGFTPLHLACFAGGAEAVRLLVERGAPLERLAEASFAQVRPLGTAVFARQHEAARVLLEAGADPNGPGAGGFTPLQAAEANGDESLARLLREHGAAAPD